MRSAPHEAGFVECGSWGQALWCTRHGTGFVVCALRGSALWCVRHGGRYPGARAVMIGLGVCLPRSSASGRAHAPVIGFVEGACPSDRFGVRVP